MREELLELIDNKISQDEREKRVFRNKRSRAVTSLIDKIVSFDTIGSMTQNTFDEVAEQLSNLFEKEEYRDVINNLLDINKNYEMLKNTRFKQKYEVFIENLIKTLEEKKEAIEKEAEEKHELRIGENKYVIIKNKILNNELLDAVDIDALFSLIMDLPIEEFEKYAKDIYECNKNTIEITNTRRTGLDRLKEKFEEVLNNPLINPVKKLFDDYFVDENNKPIVDSKNRTVYDIYPREFKFRLFCSYVRDNARMHDLFSAFKGNHEFDFLKNYATDFDNKPKLKKEQMLFTRLLLNADYDLLNDKLRKHCKDYHFTMEDLINKIPFVYKHGKTEEGTGTSGGGGESNGGDDLIIKGSYDNFNPNIKLFESINPTLPTFIMNNYPEILVESHTKIKNNIEILKIVYGNRIIDIIKNNILIIDKPNLYGSLMVLLDYKINLGKVDIADLKRSAIRAPEIKSRLDAYIEAGMLDYVRNNPSALYKLSTSEIKKFYYGNADFGTTRRIGFNEMAASLDEVEGRTRPTLSPDEYNYDINGNRIIDISKEKLVFDETGKRINGPHEYLGKVEESRGGVKHTLEGYQPGIALKHQEIPLEGETDEQKRDREMSNFSNPSLLQRYRKCINKDLKEYIDREYKTYFPKETIEYVEEYDVIKALDSMYKDENDPLIYNIDGVIIPRRKVVDVIYLYDKYCDKNDVSFINNDIDKEIYLVNAITYNSNCSHYALLKIIKAVATIIKSNKLTSSMENVLENTRPQRKLP